MRTSAASRVVRCLLPLALSGCVLEQNLDLLEYSAEDVVEADGAMEDGQPEEDGSSDEEADDDGVVDDAAGEDSAAEDAVEGDGGEELCNGLDDDGDTLTDEGFDLESDPANCGGCGVVCAALPDVTTTRCSAGSCVIDACALSRSECNDLVDDGCERELDAAHAICSIDANLTALSGDSAGPPSTANDWGDRWLTVRLTEDDGGTVPLTARIALDVPPDLDYDLFVYGGGICESCLIQSTSGSGVDETVLLRWDDTGPGTDDSRTVYIWVRFSWGSTLSCGGWTLTVTGNQAVATPNC